MNNLDDVLARLAHEPVHPGLDRIEAGVLARIGDAPSIAGMSMAALAVFVALGMGVAGAGAPAAIAQPSALTSPLGLSTPLAPSSLLAGIR